MITDNNNRFLKPEAVVPVLYKVALPKLGMLDFVVPIEETTNAFVSMVDDVNAGNDPKKKKPATHYVGALLPEVDLSQPSIVSGVIEARGFQMRLPHKIMRESYGATRLLQCYKSAGFMLAEMVNSNIISAALDGATVSSKLPTTTWDNANAKPMSDLMNQSHAMKRKGYPYRATDILLNTDNYFELMKSIESMDLAGQNIYGFPTINTDSIDVKTFGTVRDIGDEIAEGSFLVFDRNNPVIELHYYNDPLIGAGTIEYETLDAGGKPVMKTVPNIGFNFRTYMEDDTMDTILQFRLENKAMVIKPFGLLKGTGI